MFVVGDKFGMQHHIAVDNHDIVAARLRQGAVARFGQAEAVVGLPGVQQRHRKLRPIAFDHGTGIVARAVVGHNHFLRQHALRQHRTQHGFQRVGAVVRGDDERHGEPLVGLVQLDVFVVGAAGVGKGDRPAVAAVEHAAFQNIVFEKRRRAVPHRAEHGSAPFELLLCGKQIGVVLHFADEGGGAVERIMQERIFFR